MSTRGRPRKERYARLMGGFHRNKKVRRLSLEACGLLAKAWSYAADQGTDGLVPVEMLEMWAGKRHPKLMSELAGFLTVPTNEIDAEIHDWAEVNITVAEYERRLENDRGRKRSSGDFPSGNPPDIPTGNSADFQTAAQTKTKTKTKTSSTYVEEGTSGAAAPVPSERIEELSARYPADLLAEARQGCALSRRNGRMSDSCWLKTLEVLAKIEAPAVLAALQTFVEKHADGDKSEAYLIGIARGEAKRTGGKRGVFPSGKYARPAAPEAFADGDERSDPASFMEVAHG